MSVDLRQAEPGSVVAEYHTGPIGREQLQAYAQASGDLNPLHLDPAFARKAGFDDVIVHGMLSMALLGRLLTGPLGRYGLRRFDARFGGVVAVGQSLHCRATLTAREAGLARLELDALDGSGKAVLSGRADLALPPG